MGPRVDLSPEWWRRRLHFPHGRPQRAAPGESEWLHRFRAEVWGVDGGGKCIWTQSLPRLPQTGAVACGSAVVSLTLELIESRSWIGCWGRTETFWSHNTTPSSAPCNIHKQELAPPSLHQSQNIIMKWVSFHYLISEVTEVFELNWNHAKMWFYSYKCGKMNNTGRVNLLECRSLPGSPLRIFRNPFVNHQHFDLWL